MFYTCIKFDSYTFQVSEYQKWIHFMCPMNAVWQTYFSKLLTQKFHRLIQTCPYICHDRVELSWQYEYYWLNISLSKTLNLNYFLCGQTPLCQGYFRQLDYSSILLSLVIWHTFRAIIERFPKDVWWPHSSFIQVWSVPFKHFRFWNIRNSSIMCAMNAASQTCFSKLLTNYFNWLFNFSSMYVLER